MVGYRPESDKMTPGTNGREAQEAGLRTHHMRECYDVKPDSGALLTPLPSILLLSPYD